MNKKTEKRLEMALQTAAFSVHNLLISSMKPSEDGETSYHTEKSLMAAIKAVDSISRALHRLLDVQRGIFLPPISEEEDEDSLMTPDPPLNQS